MLLVLVGIVLLLRNTGVVNWDFWWDWISFFPMLLIAIGIEKIFTGSKVQFISYLTSVLLFAGGLYLALADEYRGDFSSDKIGESEFEIDEESGVRLIRANLEMRKSNLTVRDASEKLVEGKFDQTIRAPKVDHDISDGVANMQVTSRQKDVFGGVVKINFDELEDWYIRFSRNVPLELTCQSVESDLHLNLANNQVTQLTIEGEDDNIYVKLGELSPLIKVEITGSGASVRFRLPQSSGLRVESTDYHDYFGQIGLHEENGSYVSDNYGSDPVQIELKLGNDLRQISVDYY
jgi:hypothetical protein